MHSRHSMGTVSEFQAEAPQATASEGLAEGPYMVAKTEFDRCSEIGILKVLV